MSTLLAGELDLTGDAAGARKAVHTSGDSDPCNLERWSDSIQTQEIRISLISRDGEGTSTERCAVDNHEGWWSEEKMERRTDVAAHQIRSCTFCGRREVQSRGAPMKWEISALATECGATYESIANIWELKALISIERRHLVCTAIRSTRAKWPSKQVASHEADGELVARQSKGEGNKRGLTAIDAGVMRQATQILSGGWMCFIDHGKAAVLHGFPRPSTYVLKLKMVGQ
ncbi:hypothetical protein B0H17DRAFT_1138739 [Mycena rosella]|uniref:Uncharacterized protein n=1 Tax=Mycena rosella TaxID=1033263 RepID=A0AAD7D9B8_MYCRO|nr:hypothetical protein B0H17DRAFT_1138739 [Mycena rosella]